jgi:hypothetical protein
MEHTPRLGKKQMAKPSSQVDRRISSLALAAIDLRAHFEAQLRAVARVEDVLAKCRTSSEPAALESAATALRGEFQLLSESNASVRAVILQMGADAGELSCSVEN